MKKHKIFISILLIFLITFTSYTSKASDVEFVYDFEAYPIDYLNNGKYYFGILLSESEYENYTMLKINYNNLKEKFEVSKDYQLSIDNLFLKMQDTNNDILNRLEDIKKQSLEVSFFEENKFAIGIGIGITLSVVIFFAAKEM